MTTVTYLSPWIKRFIVEYLISVRNLSRNTQQSYRDTFKLLLPVVAKKVKKSIDHLAVEDLTPEVIKLFLSHLESERHCSLSTRNQRLVALHAFATFVGLNNPEHVEWCRQIRLIPLKKSEGNLITYLEKSEMNALLNAPDRSTEQGQRDYTILLFLYNTGARSDEVAQLTLGDLDIAHVPERNLSTVMIRGKGNKLRRCPLWKKTVSELNKLISERTDPSGRVFLNRCQQPLTRFGIHTMVKRHAQKVMVQFPSLKKKRVSPHTIRHTTATHLLQAGVDINTIRAWLGHVSINTTNIYAEIDLDMKTKALAHVELTDDKKQKHWREDKELMQFLDAI